MGPISDEGHGCVQRAVRNLCCSYEWGHPCLLSFVVSRRRRGRKTRIHHERCGVIWDSYLQYP